MDLPSTVRHVDKQVGTQPGGRGDMRPSAFTHYRLSQNESSRFDVHRSALTNMCAKNDLYIFVPVTFTVEP